MNDLDSVIAEARRATANGSRGYLASIVERLGGTARVDAVFGPAVERDGVTVIPVARASWLAIGGGGNGYSDKSGKDESGEGGGGIGRSFARPIGFIRIRDGDAEFVLIPDPTAIVPLIAASGLVAWLVLRGLRGLIR